MEARRESGPRHETFALPLSASEIAPEWLTHILRSDGALATSQVTSVRAKALAGNAGLMSQIVRLFPTYDRDEAAAPRSLIAKFPPADQGSRGRGVSLGFFEGECGFYRELAERSAIRAPHCYFSSYEPGTGRFLTLLEDLTADRLGNISTGCSREEATSAVNDLARFHAVWWNSTDLSHHAWLRSRSSRLVELMELIPEAWPTFRQRFGERFQTAELEILSSVRDLTKGSQGVFLTGPVSLLHGDFKLDNLFFAPSGEITVADWGLVMSGPPMFDVATFLGINLSTVDRREHEIRLIRGYVDVLANCGADQYVFDRAFQDYKTQLLGLLPQFICAGGLAEFVSSEAMDDYAKGVQRVLDAVIDHQSDRLV